MSRPVEVNDSAILIYDHYPVGRLLENGPVAQFCFTKVVVQCFGAILFYALHGQFYNTKKSFFEATPDSARDL
jgi:hypothetical protein